MPSGQQASLPVDLQEALTADPTARQRFLALPPSHQREYLKWIDEAKRPETRARRIQGTIERLMEG